MNSSVENHVIKCSNCHEDMAIGLSEFIDVTGDEELKEKILTGEFFLVKCNHCGDETLIEYPFMYTDSDAKLTVYVAPDHDKSLLDQLNSLDIPITDEQKEWHYRVVSSGQELIEKVCIFDSNRDDRVIELYKILVYEQLKEEWPSVLPSRLYYYSETDKEFFVIWDSNSTPGSEKLTVVIDDNVYNHLAEDYKFYLDIEPGKYAEINQDWIKTIVDVDQ